VDSEVLERRHGARRHRKRSRDTGSSTVRSVGPQPSAGSPLSTSAVVLGRSPTTPRLGANRAQPARQRGQLLPRRHTAPHVTWMFRQRLTGHSVASIARHLNERGVPARPVPTQTATGTEPAAPGPCAPSPSSSLMSSSPTGLPVSALARPACTPACRPRLGRRTSGPHGRAGSRGSTR